MCGDLKLRTTPIRLPCPGISLRRRYACDWRCWAASDTIVIKRIIDRSRLHFRQFRAGICAGVTLRMRQRQCRSMRCPFPWSGNIGRIPADRIVAGCETARCRSHSRSNSPIAHFVIFWRRRRRRRRRRQGITFQKQTKKVLLKNCFRRIRTAFRTRNEEDQCKNIVFVSFIDL